MKEFMITKSSIVEIQNLAENPNHDLLSQTVKDIDFYLSTLPAKIKNYGVTLVQTLAMHNCRGPPAFKCQTKN